MPSLPRPAPQAHLEDLDEAYGRLGMIHYIGNNRVSEAQSTMTLDELSLSVPAVYAGAGDRAARYPYEAAACGLDPQTTYYFVNRAR